jgi:23S rRNA (uracil1939-C5)-methyltransferase
MLSMTQKTLPTAELLIDSFSKRGYGVATIVRPHPLPPISVEVAHAIPQDKVVVELHKKMRGVRNGRLLEVMQNSPDRVEPVCKHARMCGGCCWQQMAYEAQLKEKEARIRSAFGPDAPLRPIIPAVSPFRYRNKMEFTFSENRAGTKYLGLMIAQAGYVFNVEECHLGTSWFNEVLGKTRAWWEASGLQAYYPPKDQGTLRYLTLRQATRTGQKMAILNVSGRPEFAPTRVQLNAFVEAVGEGVSIFVRVHQATKGRATEFFEMHLAGPDHIVEELHLSQGNLSFKISPTSFFQPNTLQAEKLYDAALQMLGALKPSRLYDLYCGTGTLSMAAARFFAQETVGVELSPEAVLDAEENCLRNQISNCRFIQGDVGQILAGLEKPDAVIVDPPRSGLDPAAISHLKRLMPQAILYISCNPLTQAENVKELLLAGYKLEALQPVDQFPHTYHIENIALLTKSRC